jgi:hypothetical protein
MAIRQLLLFGTNDGLYSRWRRRKRVFKTERLFRVEQADYVEIRALK